MTDYAGKKDGSGTNLKEDAKPNPTVAKESKDSTPAKSSQGKTEATAA